MTAAQRPTGELCFWCHGCGKELSANQVESYHSVGRMCLLCRSGRVVPLETPKPAEQT